MTALTVPTDEGGCGCCSCTDEQWFYESHGTDECPTSGYPCSGSSPNGEGADPATCAGGTIDTTIYSKVFPNACKANKTPKADVYAGFDDLGSVTGQTTLYCDNTGNGCQSCGFSGTITPIVEPVGTDQFKLKLIAHGENAYWGGPYSMSVYVYFYFE